MHNYILETIDVEFKGLTIRFDFLPEDEDLGSTLDDEILEDIAERIDKGELLYFCVRAQVMFEGFAIGSYAYLGSCIYEKFKDFMIGGYAEDMKEEAYENAMTWVDKWEYNIKKLKGLKNED